MCKMGELDTKEGGENNDKQKNIAIEEHKIAGHKETKVMTNETKKHHGGELETVL